MNDTVIATALRCLGVEVGASAGMIVRRKQSLERDFSVPHLSPEEAQTSVEKLEMVKKAFEALYSVDYDGIRSLVSAVDGRPFSTVPLLNATFQQPEDSNHASYYDAQGDVGRRMRGAARADDLSWDSDLFDFWGDPDNSGALEDLLLQQRSNAVPQVSQANMSVNAGQQQVQQDSSVLLHLLSFTISNRLL